MAYRHPCALHHQHLNPKLNRWDLGAAAGGAIALVQQGDPISIDIPNRRINVDLDDAELAARREAMDHAEKPWQPAKTRPRQVSPALKVYAKMVTSADKGAVRDLTLLD